MLRNSDRNILLWMGLLAATAVVATSGCETDAGVDEQRYFCSSDSDCGDGYWCYEPPDGRSYCVADDAVIDVGGTDDASDAADADTSDAGEDAVAPSQDVVSLRLESAEEIGISDVIVSPEGGFVVTGTYQRALQVGGHVIESNGSHDGFVLEVDAHGEVKRLKTLGSANEEPPARDLLVSAAFDADERLLLGGTSFAGMVYGTDDILPRTNPPNAGAQAFALVTELAGGVIWSHLFGTSENQQADETDSVLDLAATDGGEVLLAGTFDGCLHMLPQDDLEAICPASARGPIDGFVMGLERTGEEKWRTLFTGDGMVSVRHLAAGPQGRIGFNAEFFDKVTVDEIEFESTNSTYKNHLIGELDASGELLWAYAAGNSSVLTIADVEFAGDGMVVGGAFGSGVKFGATSPVATGVIDGFLTRLDEDGEPVWFVVLRGDGLVDVISGFFVDDNDRILTALRFEGSVEFASSTFEGEDGVDAALVMIDSDRQVLWAENFASEGYESIRGTATNGLRVAAVMSVTRRVEFRGTPISEPVGGTYLVLFDEPEQ